MKHMKHMIGCFAMIAAVAVIFLARGGDTPGWLPAVIVLGCPLMMVGMMVMMSRDCGNARDDSEQPERDDVRPVEQPSSVVEPDRELVVDNKVVELG